LARCSNAAKEIRPNTKSCSPRPPNARPERENFSSARKRLAPTFAGGRKARHQARHAKTARRFEELPLENDFGPFFAEFRSPNIAYWHDTGHAQIKENLGVIRHASFLESLTGRLAGFHIHDVQFPARDHARPARHD
jgi:hypothetical protein